jgi:hypothetical protein
MLVVFTSVKTEETLTHLPSKSHSEVFKVPTKKTKKFNVSDIY